MIIDYKKVYYKYYKKIASGRYSEEDRRKFRILLDWLMMEDERNDG